MFLLLNILYLFNWVNEVWKWEMHFMARYFQTMKLLYNFYLFQIFSNNQFLYLHRSNFRRNPVSSLHWIWIICISSAVTVYAHRKSFLEHKIFKFRYSISYMFHFVQTWTWWEWSLDLTRSNKLKICCTMLCNPQILLKICCSKTWIALESGLFETCSQFAQDISNLNPLFPKSLQIWNWKSPDRQYFKKCVLILTFCRAPCQYWFAENNKL